MFSKIRTSILMLALFSATVGAASAETLINGAGATFPYPLYSKWFSEYAKVDPSVKFNYQSIGSGGGIQQVKAGTVDFGASDAPLNNQRLKEMPRAIVHFPTVAGAVVLAYNLPSVTAPLQLTPDVVGSKPTAVGSLE